VTWKLKNGLNNDFKTIKKKYSLVIIRCCCFWHRQADMPSCHRSLAQNTNVKTGTLKKIYSENAWFNHIQFSPVDPDLLMFCHEGPWHKVDRIWTINVNGGYPVLMHKRTMDMEIAGHEFFKNGLSLELILKDIAIFMLSK
jgi:hypothetical protein